MKGEVHVGAGLRAGPGSQDDVEPVDILIVGGGLVGASLAASLKGSAWRVALIDAQKPPVSPEQSFKARALVLNARSVQYLKALGLWSGLSDYATPLKAVHLSKQGSWIRTRFRASDYDLDSFGQVLSADRLLYGLHQNVQIQYQKKVQTLERDAANWTLNCQDGTVFKSKLVVAADGMHSWVRRSQGISETTLEDENHALMMNLRLDRDHQGIAYERWTKDGSIALIPFGEKQMKVIWIMFKDKAQSFLDSSEDHLLQAVQKTFGFTLGLFETLEGVQKTALPRVVSSALYDRGLVLIGNAANTLHPIAAQGLNLGLRDVAHLSKCLNGASKEDLEQGAIDLLHTYAEARSSDHQRTRQWTECLAKSPGCQGIGLWAVECLEPLKRWIIKQNA